LWLTPVSISARADTCCNVLVGDIQNVLPKPGSSTVFVQIKFRITEGNPNWNHTITLEGDPGARSSMNVVYWLDLHLKKAFGVDLLSRNHWPDDVLPQKLWHWSKDSRRELFKTRASLAGFPHSMFSFHSLRAICTALLKAGSDSNGIKAVLENTAFVSGWVPNKAAQLRYVKESSKRTIVSSRLILPIEENRVAKS
jgi:hypothetical protein